MLIPRAVLHPQRHCWMWLNQHNGALKHVFITLETRTKPNVDSGNEQQNGFNRYRAHLFILPRCWRTTVFRRQSDRLPVWSGLICWGALKEAHFSNGKATHWYKRADLCLVGCHTRELATRDNTYVRWYISSTKFHCNRTREECSSPYGASKAILFDIYCLKGSSTTASHVPFFPGNTGNFQCVLLDLLLRWGRRKRTKWMTSSLPRWHHSALDHMASCPNTHQLSCHSFLMLHIWKSKYLLEKWVKNIHTPIWRVLNYFPPNNVSTIVGGRAYCFMPQKATMMWPVLFILRCIKLIKICITGDCDSNLNSRASS